MRKASARNISIIAGVLLTQSTVVYAYAERGYFAIGGEWLILPGMLLIYGCIKDFKNLIKECFLDGKRN